MSASCKRAAAAALVFAFIAASIASAKDAWIAVLTPRFHIVSDARESDAIDAARRLERFVDAFSSLVDVELPAVPLPVVAFKDDGSFAPFRPRAGGKPLNVSGFFQRADDENFMALSLHPSGDEQPYRAMFHEYAHALTARAGARWPLWLYEGLAEFSSTFEARGAQSALGRPISRHIHLLEQQTLIPVGDLVVGRQSAFPAAAESQQPIFYAESWALVHYLVASDFGRRAQPLRALFDRLAAGTPGPQALEEAVGSNLVRLDGDLRAYIHQGRYSAVVSAIKGTSNRTTLAVRALGPADVDVWLGGLLMRIGQPHEALEYLSRALSSDPRAPRLEESLGFVALNDRQYDEALVHLTRAIAQDPENPLAHYYYAETLRRRVTEQGRLLTPDVARAMTLALRAAIRLRPSFARAHYLLGYAQLVTGDDLVEGIDALQTAIRLAPPNKAAVLTLASIELKVGDLADATRHAQALIDAPDTDEAIKEDARRVLAAAERR